MKPNTPVLMLSLLIPVTPDVSAEQIMNIIGHQVVEALEQIQAQHQIAASETAAQEHDDPEAIPRAEFNASVLNETVESYSKETRDDLLGKLGYPSEV